MDNCKLSIYFNPLKKQEPENACKLVAARAGKSHVCITYPHPLHCGYYWKLLEFHIDGTEANNILKSKNPDLFRNRGSWNDEPDDVLLSLEIQPTIIGDKAFHCPVRNGKEWYRLSMVIRQWLLSAFANDFDDFIIKPSVCRRHKSQSYKTMLGVSFWLH